MTKKALCIGINNYPGAQNDLKGCVNDANAWADLLVAHYDFPKTDVQLLLDDQATKANIIQGLGELLRGAAVGDVLVFCNSSHGTYVVDTSRDELDRYDEALVPYDFQQNVILDDELRELFAGVPRGVKLSVLLDACHSGSGTREVFNPLIGYRKERFLPPAARGAVELADETSARPAKKYPQSTMNEILLSGCTSKEYSYDAQIGSAFHGAMTFYALQVIAQAGYRITYADLARQVNLALETEGYSQHPQLEGKSHNKKKLVFV